MIDTIEGTNTKSDLPVGNTRAPFGTDPIMVDQINQWWFWDETYMHYGPFESEAEARVELELYCFFCLEGRKLG